MRSGIRKWGNSLALRLPRAVVDEGSLQEGQDVELEWDQGRLVVTLARPKYALDDLVKGITKHNRHPEMDWGPPVGREVW